MSVTDYSFDQRNPWICQEFILYRKHFKGEITESTLLEKPFDMGLLTDYCQLLIQAFSFQTPPPENIHETEKYIKDLSLQAYFTSSFTSFWKDDELIGFYWCNGNLVDKMVVSPNYQRMGYGTYMLTHAFRHIFLNTTCEYAHLMCMLQNKNGLQLYRSYGLAEGKIE